MYSGLSPTSRRSSTTRSSRSRRVPMPLATSGSATMSSRVRRGFSEEYGSWKIICICRRRGRSSRRPRAATSSTWPPAARKRICPSVGARARRMQREVVVLPQPLSPTRASVSPRSTWKETSSTARTCATTRRSRPRRMGKCLRRLLTSSRRSVIGYAWCWRTTGFDRASSRKRSSRRLGIEEAGRLLRDSDRTRRRLLLIATAGHEVGASRMERAPRGAVVRMRDGALDDGQARANARLDARHGAEQSPRVGMLGLVEDGVHGPLLDDPPQIHDGDLVAHLRDHAQVVRDEDDGHALALLERPEEIQDLGLGGDVEGRGGLIGDQDARVAGQGEGDHGALAQTARQLEGILIHALLGARHADLAEHVHRPRARLRLAHVLVEPDVLDHLVAHGVHGAERGHGLLEDEGDVLPANPAHLPPIGIESREIDALRFTLAAQEDGAAHDAAGALDYPKD